MTRRVLSVSFAAALYAFFAVPCANADTIKIGRFSDQATPRRAVIGAHIDASRRRPARGENASTPAAIQAGRESPVRTSHGEAVALPNPFPSLAASAPILRAAHPAGPGSFWYSDGSGHVCMYAPSSVLPCFTVVTAAGAPAGGAVSPVG
ncbi:MAG: hypothetical protein KGJ43_00725, partial [Acidobacteriota bacterium]|nr:hypothetical protein [Acidobacteriota bacterium]